jgi:hypothetical protein
MATSLPDNNPNLPGLVPNGNPVKYAQYLQKQTTGAVKLWKPRYFLVANNTLWYFKDKGTAIVGSEVFKVDLQRCSVRQLSEKGVHYVEFVFSTAAATVETMLLKAASAGDAQKWFEKVQESKAAAGPPPSFLATPPAAAPAASTPQANFGTGSPQTTANKPSLRSSSSQRLPPPIAPSPALTERSVATSQLSNASGPSLWDRLVSTVPEQFPPAYPVSDSAVAAAAAAAAAAAQDDVTMTTVFVLMIVPPTSDAATPLPTGPQRHRHDSCSCKRRLLHRRAEAAWFIGKACGGELEGGGGGGVSLWFRVGWLHGSTIMRCKQIAQIKNNSDYAQTGDEIVSIDGEPVAVSDV